MQSQQQMLRLLACCWAAAAAGCPVVVDVRTASEFVRLPIQQCRPPPGRPAACLRLRSPEILDAT